MNIEVFNVYGFQTCFDSAASDFENIELYSLCFRGEFQRNFDGVTHVSLICRKLLVRSVATTNAKYETRQLKGSLGEPKA